MLTYTVEADVKDVTRWLNNIDLKQVPFATNQAVNETLWDVRKALVVGIQKDLDRPTKFTMGFKLRQSKKSTLKGSVEIPENRMKYLVYQIEGGRRNPKNKVLMIGQKKRNQYGNTPGFRKLRATLLAKPRHFEATMPSGTSGIWRRKGKGRTNLELIVLYTHSADYTKRFRFEERAHKVARSNFLPNWHRQMRKAIKNAK